MAIIDISEEKEYNTRNKNHKVEAMKKIYRSISSAIVLLLLAELLLYPLLAASEYLDDFIPTYTAVIGTPGLPVTVNGDGSFTVKNAEDDTVTASFGMTSVSDFSREHEPYPVVTQTFRSGGAQYILTQFAGPAGEGALAVFSELTVKNTGSEELTWPAVSETARPLDPDGIPETVGEGKIAKAAYMTPVSGAPEESGSFDSRMAEMIALWENLDSDGARVTSFPDTESYFLYRRSKIDGLIGIPDGGNVCFDAACRLLSGELTEIPADVKKAADATVTRITELSEKTYLLLTDGTPVLEDNLEALITLKSYFYMCRKTGDRAAKTVDAAYSRLLSSVAKAMEKTVSYLDCDWKEADVKGSADNLVFTLNGKNRASAEAICRWYVCSGIFSGDGSAYLSDLAESAFDVSAHAYRPDDLVPSVVTETENGALYIGRGIGCADLIDGGKISVENYLLSSGATADVTVSVNGNEIVTEVSCDRPVPLTVGVPAFRENIEYASCGFDYGTGIVTAPEGTSSVTVRLITDPATLTKENDAASALEASVFRASRQCAENCTSVSADIFNKAYENAVSARVGTAEGKTAAAAELDDAVSKLSKMIAEYTFTLSDGEQVGQITSDTLMQKFTVPSDGDLSSVLVSGEYKEGTFAAVYTLRRDGHTTDEMVCESDGERADGGTLFSFASELSGNTEYVLCIFNEKGSMSLDVRSAAPSSDGLYVRESGTDKIYSAAALDVVFTVTQADRAKLDTFYKKCVGADTSGYTKESVNALKSALKAAKTNLCTPSVTKAETKTVYENLKTAYSGLATYASDEKKVEFPHLLPVLVVSAVAVVAAAGATVIIANVRRNKKDREDLSK